MKRTPQNSVHFELRVDNPNDSNCRLFRTYDINTAHAKAGRFIGMHVKNGMYIRAFLVKCTPLKKTEAQGNVYVIAEYMVKPKF